MKLWYVCDQTRKTNTNYNDHSPAVNFTEKKKCSNQFDFAPVWLHLQNMILEGAPSTPLLLRSCGLYLVIQLCLGT